MRTEAKHPCVRGACFLAALGVTALLAGCVPSERERSLEYRTHQLESELSAAQESARLERAKTTALRRERDSVQRDRETLRAEGAALRQRVEQLGQSLADLQLAMEVDAAEPLTRPQIAPSRLPDVLDQALAAHAAKYSRRVVYDRGRAAVSFTNERLFDSGSDEVRPDAHAALAELAEIALLPEARALDVVVVGHTDDTPIRNPDTLARHPSNWHLSVHRAIAVKRVLSSAGLPDGRMAVMGYGALRPVSNDRTRNRRIEVHFVPAGAVQTLPAIGGRSS